MRVPTHCFSHFPLVAVVPLLVKIFPLSTEWKDTPHFAKKYEKLVLEAAAVLVP
jgi:hypothetical protein